MFRNQLRLIRSPHINRLLAREAVTAYRTGRKPDFKSVLQNASGSQPLSSLRVEPYDLSNAYENSQTRLN